MRLSSLLLLLALSPLSACSSAPSQDSSIQALQSVDIDGGSVQLQNAFGQGKYVTLVFWQHWCEPCLEEAPHVQADSLTYRDQVSFFGVVSGPDQSDNDRELQFTIQQLGLTYPQVRDRDGSWSRTLSVSSTPTVLVFSPQGEQVFRGHELPNWKQVLN